MKQLFTIILLSLLTNTMVSQDIIIKKNGEEISSKIIEINEAQVKYRKGSQSDGPLYSLNVSEIILIKFADGTNEVFNANPGITGQVMPTPEDLHMRGRRDSQVFYRGKNSGSGWIVATTIIFTPIIGLIPTIAVAYTEPADRNLNYPDMNLMKDPNYYNAYTDEASKTKKKKIWTSYGVSSAAWLVLILLF